MTPGRTSQSLSVVRQRIHDKSNDYFVFDYRRRDRTTWNMFYGAADALLDVHTAAVSYGSAIGSDTGVNLLACYGFLQCLYVQQDAVRTLSLAVGLDWNPRKDKRLNEIRNYRNRLTGHPSLAGEREKPPRLSSAIMPYDDITKEGFRGHVYYEDGADNIFIDATSILKDNEDKLVLQMLAIEQMMDQEERKFRAKHKASLFMPYFGNGFPYLMQRLHCQLDDASRAIQAQTHAQMIRKRIVELQADLGSRGFGSEAIDGYIERIFAGLRLLEEIISRNSSTKDDQHKFDLLYDGIEKAIGTLRSYVAEIDCKINTPIP
jgi:hypothetical protein